MVTSTWTHPLTLSGTQMNSNMCTCNQVQCVCGLPAAHQEPVPARRGRGRPAGAKNARHVDGEGRRMTAAEKKAENKWETWSKKAKAKADLALAAWAAADAAAAVSHESPAKDGKARTLAAAAAAEEVADAAWAKAAAAQEELLETKRKTETKRQKRAPPPLPAVVFDQPPPPLELPPGQLSLPPWSTPAPFVPSSPPTPTIPGMWEEYPDAYNVFQMTAEQQASLGFTWLDDRRAAGVVINNSA